MQRSALLWDDFFIQLGNWEHWAAASFLTLPLIPFLFLLLRFAFFFFFSFSLLHVQDRNNMEEISCMQPRGDGGLGGRARGRRRGGGWAGVAKFKNISGCRTRGWATALQRHTFDFSYFGCFFHIWGLPYKLMTKEVIQTRQEKTRWLHRRYFHFASEAAFLQNQEVLMK